MAIRRPRFSTQEELNRIVRDTPGTVPGGVNVWYQEAGVQLRTLDLRISNYLSRFKTMRLASS